MLATRLRVSSCALSLAALSCSCDDSGQPAQGSAGRSGQDSASGGVQSSLGGVQGYGGSDWTPTWQGAGGSAGNGAAPSGGATTIGSGSQSGGSTASGGTSALQGGVGGTSGRWGSGGTYASPTGGSGGQTGGGGTEPDLGGTGGSSEPAGSGGTVASPTGGTIGQAGGIELGGEGCGGASGCSGGNGTTNTMGALVNTYDGSRASTVSLDTGWKFNLGDVDGAEAVTFDDSSWSAVDVPHDWSISLPFNEQSSASFGGGYLDGGLGWYRKSFALPTSTPEQKYILQFDGVYMDSTVWVNGTPVCSRPYGYSSFECDFTSSANLQGANVVAVKVNNQLPSSRWYSGSGIYRHVWLKTVSPVRVAYTGTRVTTPEVSSASATVNISVTVQNDSGTDQTVQVESSVRDAAGVELTAATSPANLVAASDSADVTQTVTVLDPELWSPSTPTLYSVVTTVTVGDTLLDSYTTPFGIRTFAFDANAGFSLNDVPLKINGVCNHHDLGALGAAVNYRALEKRMQMLKEMGANALRTSHNPPAPELLAIADRLGLLVMVEAFDCWYAGKNTYDYGRFFREWADTDIKDIVARDRNHPSVIIWSIGNEVAQAGDRAVVQQLVDDIRAVDDTRPITQAYAAWVGVDSMTGLEDIVGINYAPDRYDSVHTENPAWRLIASESSSALRSRGIYNNEGTQCSSYDDTAAGWGHTAEKSWQNVNTRDWIAGEFVWTGFDYIGEPTPYEWPAKSSYFGIIDTANFPKDIFYFYQSKWSAAGPTMVHIVPMDWTTWTPGRAVKVMVYTNADSVELFLNGESLGSKAMDAAAGHLEWSVPYAAGTLEAEASKGGTVVGSDVVRTAGEPAALTLAVDRDSIAADGRDLAFIEVDVVDAEGVLVPNADNTIDFAIDGPGRLVGVDNGNPISHESYKGTSRSAFSGKALAIVQSTAESGRVTLRATSEPLAGSSIAIETESP